MTRPPSKAMSLRLSEEMAGDAAAVARTDDQSMSEFVREAIKSHIASRRADQDFQKRLARRLEEDRATLESLLATDDSEAAAPEARPPDPAPA